MALIKTFIAVLRRLNRYFRTKIGSSYSTWSDLILGVPQGSVLGPLLFNIYMNDIFYFLKECDVCNFADDTTLYTCDKSVKEVVRKLEHDFLICQDWYNNNNMKLNEDKCHFLMLGHKNEHIFLNAGNSKLWEEKYVNLLGLSIDSKLEFTQHVVNI